MNKAVLYDGPDAVELTATPYRRWKYQVFHDNPDASRVVVSMEMALAMRSAAAAACQDLYTSTARVALNSSDIPGGSSESMRRNASSRVPVSPGLTSTEHAPELDKT